MLRIKTDSEWEIYFYCTGFEYKFINTCCQKSSTIVFIFIIFCFFLRAVFLFYSQQDMQIDLCWTSEGHEGWLEDFGLSNYLIGEWNCLSDNTLEGSW